MRSLPDREGIEGHRKEIAQAWKNPVFRAGEKHDLPGQEGEDLGPEGEGLPCRTEQESSFQQEQSFATGKTCPHLFLDSSFQQQ